MSDPGPLPPGTVAFPTLGPADVGPVLDAPAQLALQHTVDGDLIAVGFSDLAGLVAAFGPDSPGWPSTATTIPLLLQGSGVTQVLIDAPVRRDR